MALETLEKEKDISREIMLEAIENSLITECKGHFGRDTDNFRVEIDRNTYDFHVYVDKTVVEEPDNDVTEISLAEAKMIDSKYELGDVVSEEIKSKEFGRITTQNARNVILQKIREEERKVLFDQYYAKEKDVVTGVVQRYIGKNVSVNLGKVDAILNENEMVKGEVFKPTERIKVYFSLTQIYDPVTNSASPYGLLTICSMLAWGLGYFGMPHVLLRFMAIEDAKKLKLSRRVATVWVVISMIIAVFIGVVGNAMTKAGVIPVLEDPETIILVVADLISRHGFLAAIVAGLILAGILAATMSTADSQLLAASSSASQNILKEVFVKDMSEKTGMVVARVTVLIIAVIAMFIARDSDSSVFQIVSFAWAGFGASFGPLVLLALFWKRSTLQGALSGMVCGGAMIFIWKFLVRPMGGVLGIYELLPAFLVGLAVNIIVSLLTPAPSQEIQEEFDKVAAMK